MAEQKRRLRRAAEACDTDEFRDPLSNYDPAVYDDGLELALCEAQVRDMHITPFATFPVTLSIETAIATMSRNDYFALMIVDDEGRLAGIFSERDVLVKVAEQYEQLKDHPVSEVMTPDPVVIYETDSPAKAVNLMAVGGFRHLPVLGVDDRVVGILGPQRMARYIHAHFDDRAPEPPRAAAGPKA